MIAARDPVPAVRFERVSKRFGAVIANRDISFEIAAGSVHAIIGENGAGKSTLAHILSGFLQPDAGAIHVHGAHGRIASPSAALVLGIGMVHQHFMLVEPFTVAENLALAMARGTSLRGALARARATLSDLGERYGLSLDPDAVVATLPLGLRQRAEILKLLARGPRLLVLDEPTAALTPVETERLFTMLRGLAAEGRTVVLITHKLAEVMAVADRVTVLRAGAHVADRDIAATSEGELAELMVGHRLPPAREKRLQAPGGDLVEARGLIVAQDGKRQLDGVDITLRRGEILGVAGIAGNGQTALLEALAGLVRPAAGSIAWRGTHLAARHPARRLRRLGLGVVPEDRHRQGLVGALTAWENFILGHQRERRWHRGLGLARSAIWAATGRAMADYAIRPPDPDLLVAAFSGGNQQKLVMARELDRHPALLLVAEPTRGIDIGAAEIIHARLAALREGGCAILLVSSDLDEILELADRIAVMAGGRVIGTLARAEATAQTLGLMMAGIARPDGSGAA